MRAAASTIAGIALTTALAGCGSSGSRPPTPESGGILSVSMHRTGCFGTCPAYTVVVKADGSVVFNGEDHVKVKGESKRRVSNEDFTYLIQSIDRLDYFTWKDRYLSEADGCTRWWTDSTTVTLEVERGPSAKRVAYYYGCDGIPVARKIDLLSKIVDDVAGTADLIGEDQ